MPYADKLVLAIGCVGEADMKDLDTQDLFEYGRAAIAVLRVLQIKKETISYADFARAIGLLEGPNDKWQAWHRQQTDAILNGVAALEGQARKMSMSLEYDRVVNKRTGSSGKGIAKQSRIVRK